MRIVKFKIKPNTIQTAECYLRAGETKIIVEHYDSCIESLLLCFIDAGGRIIRKTDFNSMINIGEYMGFYLQYTLSHCGQAKDEYIVKTIIS